MCYVTLQRVRNSESEDSAESEGTDQFCKFVEPSVAPGFSIGKIRSCRIYV